MRGMRRRRWLKYQAFFSDVSYQKILVLEGFSQNQTISIIISISSYLILSYFIYLSIYLSVCVSVCLSVSLSVYVFIYLSFFVCDSYIYIYDYELSTFFVVSFQIRYKSSMAYDGCMYIYDHILFIYVYIYIQLNPLRNLQKMVCCHRNIPIQNWDDCWTGCACGRLGLVGCREENSDRNGKILCKGLVYGDSQFFSIIFYDHPQ